MKIDDFLDGAGDNQGGGGVPAKDESGDDEIPTPSKPVEGIPDAPTSSATTNDRQLGSEVQNVLRQFENSVAQKDLKAVAQSYAKLQDVSHRVAAQSIAMRNDVLDKLQHANETLLRRLEQMARDAEQTMNEMQRVLNEGIMMLQQGDLQGSMRMYGDLNKLYAKLPDELDERKAAMQQSLLTYYLHLKQRLMDATGKQMQATHQQVHGLLEQGRYALKAGDLLKAREAYRQANVLYAKLPGGHLHEKALLYREILAFYEEMNVSAEIAQLQTQLGRIHQKESSLHIDHAPGAKELPAQPAPSQKVSVSTARSSMKTKPQVSPEQEREQLASQLISIKHTLAQAKLKRASMAIKEGNRRVAQEDIKSVLSLEPENAKAKAMMREL